MDNQQNLCWLARSGGPAHRSPSLLESGVYCAVTSNEEVLPGTADISRPELAMQTVDPLMSCCGCSA